MVRRAFGFSATYDGDGLRATSDGTTWTWDAARGLPQVLSDGSTTCASARGAVAPWNGGACAHTIASEVFGVG